MEIILYSIAVGLLVAAISLVIWLERDGRRNLERRWPY